MFYYYGGKAGVASRYPVPQFPTVVEPFAGGAGYSMHHLFKGNIERVVLVEKDPRVAGLWKRLLEMTPDEVMAIPVPPAGSNTADFFYMTTATSNGVARSHRMTVTKRMPELIEMMKRRVARLLPVAKGHVEVIEGDYSQAPNIEATWFIDPPYQPHVAKRTSSRTGSPQGMGYAPGCDSSSLGFEALSRWCRGRDGQVLVVEQEGADWLPFLPLLARQHDSLNQPKVEVLWTKGAADPNQLALLDEETA